MFSLTTVESVLHRISLCSSACVFNRAESQMKCIPLALKNYVSAISPTYVLQALGFNIVLSQKQTKYIPPVTINPTFASYCSCTPSSPKHVFQAPRFNGALLQKEIQYIPSTSINPTSAFYCSCTPSSPKHVLQAPSSVFPCPASTEPCPRLLAALPSCLEVRRFLHHSNLSCTRASIPHMKSSKSLIDRSLVPKLLEKDLTESAIKGWGPGGQAVNKSNNAVFLKHVPTGLFVKVHKHRMRHKNAIEARVLLLEKLDDLVNGPRSVSAQKALLLKKRSVKSEGKARKMRDLKAQWKQAQGGADTSAGEDNLRDEDDGSRDESARYEGLRDESAGCDGLRDESGSGSGLRHEKTGNLGVDSRDSSANCEIGSREQGNYLNKRT